MSAEIEVWTLRGRTTVALEGPRVTIGKGPDNGISIADDTTISRLHAVLEQFDAGWCITDLGSSNGTTVNGDRIIAQHRLRHGDEVRVGRTRLLFRNSDDMGHTATDADAVAPILTPREHDVLVVLCRPLLDRDLFTEPASIKEVAAHLVVSEAAVKQHLANLYAKFELGEDVSHRRTRLANEALRRGAVRLGDLAE